jgi:hypothetical protein
MMLSANSASRESWSELILKFFSSTAGLLLSCRQEGIRAIPADTNRNCLMADLRESGIRIVDLLLNRFTSKVREKKQSLQEIFSA